MAYLESSWVYYLQHAKETNCLQINTEGSFFYAFLLGPVNLKYTNYKYIGNIKGLDTWSLSTSIHLAHSFEIPATDPSVMPSCRVQWSEHFAEYYMYWAMHPNALFVPWKSWSELVSISMYNDIHIFKASEFLQVLPLKMTPQTIFFFNST